MTANMRIYGRVTNVGRTTVAAMMCELDTTQVPAQGSVTLRPGQSSTIYPVNERGAQNLLEYHGAKITPQIGADKQPIMILDWTTAEH